MIQTVLDSLLKCLDSFFQLCKSTSDNKSTSTIIQDGQDQKRACRYAELAIELVESKGKFNRVLDQKRFRRLVKKFRKWK